jgi:hypothetical protein
MIYFPERKYSKQSRNISHSAGTGAKKKKGT